jgi:hypothetical protein
MKKSLNNIPVSLLSKIWTYKGLLPIKDVMVDSYQPIIVLVTEKIEIMPKDTASFTITMKSKHTGNTLYANGMPIFGSNIRFISNTNEIVDNPTTGTVIKCLSLKRFNLKKIDYDISDVKLTIEKKELTEECGIIQLNYDNIDSIKSKIGSIYCIILGGGCLVPIQSY